MNGERFRPLHPHARISSSNGDRVLPLSQALLTFTFLGGLWDRINERCGCLIDEYEEDDISWEFLPEALQELRDCESGTTTPESVREELREVIDLAEDAHGRGLGVVVTV